MMIADVLLFSLTIFCAILFTWFFYTNVHIPPPTIGVYNLWDIGLLCVVISLATLLHIHEYQWLVFGGMLFPSIFIFHKLFAALFNGRFPLYLSFAMPFIPLFTQWFLPNPTINQIVHAIIVILWSVGLANLLIQGGLSVKAVLIYALFAVISLIVTPSANTYIPLMPAISLNTLYLTIHIPLLLAMLPIAIQQQNSINKDS